MIRYLEVNAVCSLVQKIGLEEILTALAGYITEDFRRWPQFEKEPRSVHHSPVGVNELMPIGDDQLYSFKYVNGHPQNTELGLPTVLAFGMLAEVATGMPLLISDLTLGTALRTAAVSAVAAQKLARPNSKNMAVIGCGAQSEFQIIAFKALLGVNNICVYDSDPKAIEKLQRNLSGTKGLTIMAATSVRDAVKGVDIITTVTADKSRATILTGDMIETGMHINGVGGDCPGKTELHPDVLRKARVVVEYMPQTRIEGDIQQMPPDFPVVELWRVLTDEEQGRQNHEQVTVFDSVGFALEDFSMLRYLNDIAAEHNAGTRLDLIPLQQNPKDLFGILQQMPLTVPPMKARATAERK